MELGTEQVFAVYDAEDWWHKSNEQIFEIMGPAGSGKTTIILYLIERLGLTLEQVLFVAYMGKAAMVMAQKGLPAKTIHSTIYRYEKEMVVEDGHIVLNANGRPKTKLVQQLKDKISNKIKLIVVDEGGLVNEEIGRDLASFGVPIIALGDPNQLPPIFGKSFFFKHPNVILTKVMRQAEGNPIIWLSQEVLQGNRLQKGIYGNSAVISKSDLNEYMFSQADEVITYTNRLRYEVNNLFREQFKKIKRLDTPVVGEKVVCRKNNWSKCIDDNVYLTNGTTGYIDYVDMSKFDGSKFKMDFLPDFSLTPFKNLQVDYKAMYAKPNEDVSSGYDFTTDKFEFGYAITTHMSQGSQFDNVLLLVEDCMPSNIRKNILYTGITRAVQRITIVI